MVRIHEHVLLDHLQMWRCLHSHTSACYIYISKEEEGKQHKEEEKRHLLAQKAFHRPFAASKVETLTLLSPRKNVAMPLLIFRGIATFLFRRKQCIVITVFVGVQFFFRIETFSTWFTFGLHIHDWIFRHLFYLFISPCSCPFFSLLLNSLLSWLGDFFFLLQEPLTSSFNSKLKVSLPILRAKENSLLSAESAWQKAKHSWTTALSILGSHFPVGFWTKNFDRKWKSYAHPFTKV